MDIDFAMFYTLYYFFAGAAIYAGTNIYFEKTKYKLKKQLDVSSVDKVVLPPALKQSLMELPGVQDDVLKKALIKFTEVLKTNFSEEILENLYTNLKSLSIEEGNLISWIQLMVKDKATYVGFYYDQKNEIKIFSYDSIFHELFHMASCRFCKRDNIFYSGFETLLYDKENDSYYYLGKGLNEGYTELLNQRYFGKKYKFKVAYKEEVHYAKHLEKIVGKENMEKFYLQTDFRSLEHELEDLIDVESVLLLLKELDSQVKKTIKRYKYANSILLKMYSNKLLKEVYEGKISLDDANKQFLEFGKSLAKKNKVDYDSINDWLVKQYINDKNITRRKERRF